MAWLCPVQWGHFKEIDFKIACDAKSKGCPLCGGVLDWASFPRKARGADCLGEERRCSFCCRVCRKRVTPPSVRFIWKKIYVLLFIALAPGRSDLAQEICRRTLGRWRSFWADQLSVQNWFIVTVRHRLPVEFGFKLSSLVTIFIDERKPQFSSLASLLSPLGCAPRLRLQYFRAEDAR